MKQLNPVEEYVLDHYETKTVAQMSAILEKPQSSVHYWVKKLGLQDKVKPHVMRRREIVESDDFDVTAVGPGGNWLV